MSMTETEWRARFAGKLSHMIKARGCTQSEFAEEAGISEKSLNRYINGIRTPKAPILLKLASAFDCNPLELLEFEE